MSPLRVLLADDHGIVRDGVRLALESSGDDHHVVGEVADGSAVIAACRERKPDVVILDVKMPLLDGVSAMRQIAALTPTPRAIALTAHADARTVREMLAAGASGYVLKTEPVEELVRAVRAVARGGVYLSPSVAGSVVDLAVGGGPAPVAPSAAGGARLSPREQEVLLLIASGKSTKEIAAELGVSVKTIETQRKHVMDKLGVFSVAGLTKYAIREGLMDP